MENKYFEGKLRFRKTLDNGTQKVVTEAYIVNALSYTEAEARLSEEVAAYISGEFKITNIRLTNYVEVHPSEGDYWFKSKVSLLAYDEESGKEKKTNIYMLIQAEDVEEAYSKTHVAMSNTMGDYKVHTISETSILEFFPYLVEGFVAQ